MPFQTYRYVITVVLTLWAATVAAQSISKGTYVTEGGWGTLSVYKDGRFHIQSIGANGHSCDVEAVLNGMKATTSEGCSILFERSLDRVHVSPDLRTEETCRHHCGTRAAFEGDYFSEVLACRAQLVNQDRSRFAGLYKERKYREAAEVLGTLLTRCGRFLYWQPDAEVRNDLAVTYHHLHDDAACIGVLSPLRRVFVEDERLTARAFTPADADWGEQMVNTTRFNWKACGGQVPEDDKPHE
jgi:hypothetical protein